MKDKYEKGDFPSVRGSATQYRPSEPQYSAVVETQTRLQEDYDNRLIHSLGTGSVILTDSSTGAKSCALAVFAPSRKHNSVKPGGTEQVEAVSRLSGVWVTREMAIAECAAAAEQGDEQFSVAVTESVEFTALKTDAPAPTVAQPEQLAA